MEYAVSVFEFKNIAKGIEASDTALKAAGVKLVVAQPVCPGKFELIITGQLAQTAAVADILLAKFSEYIIDHTQIGRIEKAVFSALLGAQPPRAGGAIGILETFTVSSIIWAADAGVKSANVEILELRVAHGMAGKGYASFVGDVADVQAAVDAAAVYAKKEGTYVASTIIAAPHPELWEYL